MDAYAAGVRARRACRHRVLANPANEAEHREWLRGWDEMDIQLAGGAFRHDAESRAWAAYCRNAKPPIVATNDAARYSAALAAFAEGWKCRELRAVSHLRDRLETEQLTLTRYVHFNRDELAEAVIAGRMELLRLVLDEINHGRTGGDDAQEESQSQEA